MRSLKNLVNLLITSFLLSFLAVIPAMAAGDLGVDSNSLYFSDNYFLEGKQTTIYVKVNNNHEKDLLGTVQVKSSKTGEQIGTDQVVSALSGKSDTIFVYWIPKPGEDEIVASILPWDADLDDPSNNVISQKVIVDYDTDRDGTANQYDNDDDNDGVSDSEDAFPLNSGESKDSDGDGTGDNADNDDDNDGTLDSEDEMPLDPNETKDTDGDGIGDNADNDDDNDGINDSEEEVIHQTDPQNPDSDGDGTNDGEDAFPLDASESSDKDGDGIGDNTDNDADNDGIPKDLDPNDLNEGPFIILSNDPGSVTPGTEVNLDASSSYDEDGSISSFEWLVDNEEGEQKKYTESRLIASFDKPGTKKIKLTVTDDQGESRSKYIEIRVMNYVPYLIFGFILAILLALYIAFKYTAGAKKRGKKAKTVKKQANTPKKQAKTTSKKRKKDKSTKS